MHEAAPVRNALAAVLDGWPVDRTDGHLRFEVLDPTRAHADAVAFYGRALLADRGLPSVTFEVAVHDAGCAMCGATVTPEPHDPSCPRCGFPLPRTDGPAVLCREVTPCA